jgi:hypothetical protein
MATKAEVQAAIEAIGIATAHAAVVAAALTEDTGPVIPPQAADVLITKTGTGLLITTRPGIDEVRWTLAQNAAPNYPWYGPLHPDPIPAGGLRIDNPQYAHDGDFVKVMWGPGYANSLDGPKDTKAVVKPATPTGGKVIANWRVGLNIERFRPSEMTWQGALLTLPNYYVSYMPSIGCNWARFFIPFGSEHDMGVGTQNTPDVHRFDGIIEAARVASQSRIGVSLGLTDVLEAWSVDTRWDAVKQNVQNVARAVKDKLDPNYVVLETANELGGGDNAFFNGKRIELHNIIRAECPNHTIAHGCAGWNNKNWGDDWAQPPDSNVVLRYHKYSRGVWQDIQPCIDQATKLGTLWYGGEVMPEFGNSSLDDWGRNWMDCLDNNGHACAGWAVTTGRDFQMSRGGTDATLLPDLEAWTKAVSAKYKV